MSEARPKKLCVITPCFNETEVVPLFHDALSKVLASLSGLDYEIVFVDDGSRDGTLERLNAIADADPHISVLSLSRNFGHQIALTAGLDFARADAVIMMDSDLQHPPALIPEMVRLWQGGADVVSAVRRSTADASLLKRTSSQGFYRLINLLSETPIRSGAADYCLLSRRAARALREMPERHRFLRGLVSWMGFRREFVEFEAPPRAAGKSKYPLRKMVTLALDAVFSFSVAPIRAATRIGMSVVALGMIYLLYVLIRYLWLRDLAQGWGSLMSVVLILGGLQFMFIGMIGEYIGRVFEQVKGRPVYLLKQRRRRRRALNHDVASRDLAARKVASTAEASS